MFLREIRSSQRYLFASRVARLQTCGPFEECMRQSDREAMFRSACGDEIKDEQQFAPTVSASSRECCNWVANNALSADRCSHVPTFAGERNDGPRNLRALSRGVLESHAVFTDVCQFHTSFPIGPVRIYWVVPVPDDELTFSADGHNSAVRRTPGTVSRM